MSKNQDFNNQDFNNQDYRKQVFINKFSDKFFNRFENKKPDDNKTQDIQNTYNLRVSISPHIHDGSNTSRIMLDVLIALVPAFIVSILFFGPRAALITIVCVASCVLFEWLCQKLMKRPITIGDYSACVTGVLLAFNLPVTIPIWEAIIGSAIAIILVKQIFGGLGKNFVNPAITARIVLFLAFSSAMTTWSAPPVWSLSPDAVTGPTPLAIMDNPNLGELPVLWQMFVGMHGGSFGETSVLALTIGWIYLMIRKVITWHIPITYIGFVFIFTFLLGHNPVYHILTGGLFLGAIFMATDYVTSPQTDYGKLVFGILCAFFTVLIRIYSNYPEGVSFAILIMNILNPYINKYVVHKPLGGLKK